MGAKSTHSEVHANFFKRFLDKLRLYPVSLITAIAGMAGGVIVAANVFGHWVDENRAPWSYLVFAVGILGGLAVFLLSLSKKTK